MPDNRFWRDASDRLTFGMFGVSADRYCSVRDALVKEFGLAATTAPVDGYGLVFQEFGRAEQAVELAWEYSAGFTVGARSQASESMVRGIAAWLLRSEWATMDDLANPLHGPER